MRIGIEREECNEDRHWEGKSATRIGMKECGA